MISEDLGIKLENVNLEMINKILKNGKIFDKVGVNFSQVSGKFPKQFQKKIPGALKDPRFWASGISVVMHMKNPLIQLCILIQDLLRPLRNGLVEAWILHLV